MDFTYTYTEDQEEFRAEVRAWLEANIPDDMRAPVDRMELTRPQYDFWRDMHKTLAEKGWLYPYLPQRVRRRRTHRRARDHHPRRVQARPRSPRLHQQPRLPDPASLGRRIPEGQVPQAAAQRRQGRLPELLRTQRRFRPRLPPEPSRTRRRRLHPQRTEDMD